MPPSAQRATAHVSALFAVLPFVSIVSAAAAEKRPFDVSQHLGNLSPYFTAPAAHGVVADLPGDCSVDQVMLVRVSLVAHTWLRRL